MSISALHSCLARLWFIQSELEDDLDDLVAVANGEKGSTSKRSTHVESTQRGTGRPVTTLFDDDSSDNGDGVRNDSKSEEALASKAKSSTTKALAVHRASATSSASKSHHGQSASGTTFTSSTIWQRLIELVRAKAGKEVRVYLFDVRGPLLMNHDILYETAIQQT